MKHEIVEVSVRHRKRNGAIDSSPYPGDTGRESFPEKLSRPVQAGLERRGVNCGLSRWSLKVNGRSYLRALVNEVVRQLNDRPYKKLAN